jgi:hypothetical protein
MGYVADKAVVNVGCLLGVEEEDKASSRHSRKGNSVEESNNQRILLIIIECRIIRFNYRACLDSYSLRTDRIRTTPAGSQTLPSSHSSTPIVYIGSMMK